MTISSRLGFCVVLKNKANFFPTLMLNAVSVLLLTKPSVSFVSYFMMNFTYLLIHNFHTLEWQTCRLTSRQRPQRLTHHTHNQVVLYSKLHECGDCRSRTRRTFRCFWHTSQEALNW